MIYWLESDRSSVRTGGNPPVSASVGLRGRCSRRRRRHLRRFGREFVGSSSAPVEAILRLSE